MTEEVEETWGESYSDNYAESYSESNYSRSSTTNEFRWTDEHQKSLERLKEKVLIRREEVFHIQKGLAGLTKEDVKDQTDEYVQKKLERIFLEVPKEEDISLNAMNDELKAEMGLND